MTQMKQYRSLEPSKTHALEKYPSVTITETNLIQVHEKENLSQAEQTRLLDIIHAEELKTKNYHYYICGKIGTISAWSNKAFNILNACQINKITCIEPIRAIQFISEKKLNQNEKNDILKQISDPLTESIFETIQIYNQAKTKITSHKKSQSIPLEQLANYLKKHNLNLSNDEIKHLTQIYQQENRNLNDIEIYMYAQINSEHCRHKIFNANWTINDIKQDESLFDWIKQTYQTTPSNVISAYSDNAAIIQGAQSETISVDQNNIYQIKQQLEHNIIKVETHNHPTAIEPFSGAATGVGGEIRDEGATGTGSKPKMGLSGFSVSNLNLKDYPLDWEKNSFTYPSNIQNAQNIMIKGPLGAASYSNEFGRPNLLGYFRSFEMKLAEKNLGYHKPIMIAGGLGTILDHKTDKPAITKTTYLVVLGGPAMKIGLGGSTSSSNTLDSKEADNQSSVQRANPEIERQCQEVINTCTNLDQNPIAFIHDVGAGGLSNAFPELINDGKTGGIFDLQAIPCDEKNLSPLEIWCNEAQERYALAIFKDQIKTFKQICQRENVLFAIIGETKTEKRIQLKDQHNQENPIDLNLDNILKQTPKKKIITQTPKINTQTIEIKDNIKTLALKVLSHPTVADKSFLINIGDRSVGGLTIQDQMIGPWQIPISNYAMSAKDFNTIKGEAMSMGERTPLASVNAKASANMAIAEAITNLIATPFKELSNIKLSANWMANSENKDEQYHLYQAVKACSELAQTLNLTIPVGKDSMSMTTQWQENKQLKTVDSPVSLIISAFTNIDDTSKAKTPLLNLKEKSRLILFDIGAKQNRMGGSILEQTNNKMSSKTPDIDNPILFKKSIQLMQILLEKNLILACHDKSDGGLLTTLSEMMFAAKTNLTIDISQLGNNPIDSLFNEECGWIIQIEEKNQKRVNQIIEQYELNHITHDIGTPNKEQDTNILHNQKNILKINYNELYQAWIEHTYQIEKLRDNPNSAKQAKQSKQNQAKELNFKINFQNKSTYLKSNIKPKVAILREQGVNSQKEMATAFMKSGFQCFDLHINDLMTNPQKLLNCQVLAVPGGFSYGDVLGAGRGWAKRIQYNPILKEIFYQFFNQDQSLTLGVCNGCQMLSELTELIPGSENWPKFKHNDSKRYEARLIQTYIPTSKSILLNGLSGSSIPIVISHAEGKASLTNQQLQNLINKQQITLQYGHQANQVSTYPQNPNGSSHNIASVCSEDGKVTIMMPHPERTQQMKNFSWSPLEHNQPSPWLQIFNNAYTQLT